MIANGELNPQFSSPDAEATQWATAREQLEAAMTHWLSTVRSDGRPHVTTIAAVWLDDAVHFTTGHSERQAKNLAAGNSHVIVTTGCNGWDGLDIVIEGDAIPVTDPDRLGRVAEAFTEKYDDFFGMRMVDGHLSGAGTDHEPLTFAVRAMRAFGFGKGESFSQTRWTFGRDDATGG